jgi:hypothetical protein
MPLVLLASFGLLDTDRRFLLAPSEREHQKAMREAVYGEFEPGEAVDGEFKHFGPRPSLEDARPPLEDPRPRLAMLNLERGQTAGEQGHVRLGLHWFVGSLSAATDARNRDGKISLWPTSFY